MEILGCLSKEANGVYQAQTRREAVDFFREWASKCHAVTPMAMACSENDSEGLLNSLSCPQEHWRKLRATNVIKLPFERQDVEPDL